MTEKITATKKQEDAYIKTYISMITSTPPNTTQITMAAITEDDEPVYGKSPVEALLPILQKLSNIKENIKNFFTRGR